MVVELLGRVAGGQGRRVEARERARDEVVAQVADRVDGPLADWVAADRNRDLDHVARLARRDGRLAEHGPTRELGLEPSDAGAQLPRRRVTGDRDLDGIGRLAGKLLTQQHVALLGLEAVGQRAPPLRTRLEPEDRHCQRNEEARAEHEA